jgi:hypothetical protein
VRIAASQEREQLLPHYFVGIHLHPLLSENISPLFPEAHGPRYKAALEVACLLAAAFVNVFLILTAGAQKRLDRSMTK